MYISIVYLTGGATKQSEIQPTVKPTSKSHSKQPSTSASPSSQQILEWNNEPTSPSHGIYSRSRLWANKFKTQLTYSLIIFSGFAYIHLNIIEVLLIFILILVFIRLKR